MINNVVLTGKVVELPQLQESAIGIKYANVLLEVTRPFKNSSGVYNVDRIPVVLWRDIAEVACEVCKIGDLLGVKGWIQSHEISKDNQTYYTYEVVVEHVSFMTGIEEVKEND